MGFLRTASKKTVAASLLFCLFSACPSTFASLVIALYHKETIYLASDSVATWYPDGKARASVRKIFRISENCCAAVTGFAIHDIESSSGKPIFSLNVLKALERLCAVELTNSASVDRKMESIAKAFNQGYCSYFSNRVAITGTAYDHDPTRLQFAGYNAEKRCFFISSCLLDGTNAAHIEPIKEYRRFDDPDPISLQGEVEFLRALFNEEKPELQKLVPAGFAEAAAELDSTNSVSDGRVKNFILEMFQLHKDNAARLGYNKGWIGPPYRIFN